MTIPRCCGLEFESDGSLRWKFRPSQKSFHTFTDQDTNPRTPRCRYSINSQGFRGPELKSEPSILFLGCSHTFGMGVNDWETIPILVQKKLEVQCINAGVPGYGPFQCAKLWPRLVDAHQICAIIWQKPRTYRFSEDDSSLDSVWLRRHYEEEFETLAKTDALSYGRRVAKAIRMEIRWYEELSNYCKPNKIPVLSLLYEAEDSRLEEESLNVAIQAGFVISPRMVLREALSCREYTDIPGKYPKSSYYCMEEDWHPNLLYNEITSDVLTALLRRELHER